MSERDVEASSHVVRVFPGYAGTVLWAAFGTVEYDESLLSDDLVRALGEWERIGESAGVTGVPLDPAVQAAWSVEALRLAHELAAELGPGFTIDIDDRSGKQVLVRSERPATNPDAAAVFESQRARYVVEEKELQARLDSIPLEERRFFRYAPLKGHDLT
jgi:hypothetical protein